MKKSLIVLLAVLLFAVPAQAREPDKAATRKRVIVVVVDGISAADLLDNPMPELRKALSKRAAAGLMNARSAKGAADKASGYLSVGMGARGDAGTYGHIAANHGETIVLGGIPQPAWPGEGGAVTTPSIPEITRLSADLGYPATPGTLGEALKNAGIKRAVFGNSDTLGVYHREMNLITMDGSGATDFGDVRMPLNTTEQVLSAIDKGLRQARMVAVEFAPTSRISSRRNFLSDKAVAAQKKQTLGDIDALIGELTSERYLDKRTMVIIATPFPSMEAAKAGDFQTPLVIAADGYRGLLTSAGTRWPGVVTNQDIAPTVMRFLDVPAPPELAGRPLESEPAADPLSLLETIDSKAAINYASRSILLTAFISLAVALIAGAGVALLLVPASRGTAYIQGGLLGLLFFPLSALIANAAYPPASWFPILAIAAMSLGLGYGTWASFRSRPLTAILIPCALLVATLVVQLPMGSVLERNSVMGMSSIFGARFYGIGNEYMGLLLASAVLCLSVWLTIRQGDTRRTGIMVAAWMSAVVLILGLPSLGANVGGALAAAATGVLAFHLLRGKTLRLQHLVFLASGLIFVVAIILAADYFSSNASHAGRAAAAVGSGGPKEALMIITRKVAVNFLLITRSSWTNIIVAAAVATVALLLGQAKLVEKVSNEHKTMIAGIKVIILGAVAALLLNDSGVVAAALMVVFAVNAWLYLLIQAEEYDL